MRERRACLAIGLLPPPQDGVRPGAPTDVRVAYAEGYAPFRTRSRTFGNNSRLLTITILSGKFRGSAAFRDSMLDAVIRQHPPSLVVMLVEAWKLLLQLAHLGPIVENDVRILWMLLEIVLMIVFRWIEVR